MPANNSPQVLIVPLKPALILGMAQRLPVLVRVQAPDPDPARQKVRKPYQLSLVIDRSGSMSGEPLLEAVRCARHMIDRLAPTDLASLVTFDDRVDVMVPAQPVGDRKTLYSALAHIRSGGSTNLHGGWKAGMESILPGASNAALARVILLSDGNANVGETTGSAEIAALCAAAAEQGVTTSTYGLGRDFNEDLMVRMAQRGGGNHYYGDTAADLLEPFAEEFDFISSLYAHQVRLSLAAPAGVKMTLINDYPVEAREGFPMIRLPDIPFGAEAWALVELEIPAGMALDAGSQLLQAEVTCTSPDGVPLAIPDARLVLPALSPQAWDALLADPLVTARQAELEAGRFLDQARRSAEQGDWEAIARMIEVARQRFAEHPWVMEILQGMADLAKARDSARFSKEAMYSARKMNSRVSAKEEVLACLEMEGDMPSFLRRKKQQGKAEFEPRPDSDKP
jgi:Ca-activated chloride channel homolog